MSKILSIILFGLILSQSYFAQPKLFGYKISGNGDIISDVFLIQDGFVLDSVLVDGLTTYRFEYYTGGKLKRQINMRGLYNVTTHKFRPTCLEYFYNEQGFIDSANQEVWYDTIWVYGSNVKFAYDNNYNLLSKVTIFENGDTLRNEDNGYDSSGNLILNKVILQAYEDTTLTFREYDSQNRLTKVNISNSPYHADQILYQYDSLGNINCLFQDIDLTDVNNISMHRLIFDESGKVEKEIKSRMYNPADSSWLDSGEILFNYDENDRMIQMGPTCWFQYNADGNIDSILNTHPPIGYIGLKGTLIDSYGNTITLPPYNYTCHFYYSTLITNINKGNKKDISFTLSQNYPNPFNPATTITYTLPKSSLVTLKVYDILGKEVATLVNEEKIGGTYTAEWNARDAASGVYFYKITAGGYSKVNKMMLLK